ncbi:type I polyketide synthase [Pandoraea sputorum]|uniref:Malonyl CoA-ACP transacylase n=1 Tax=Pandoraea sputorum TaxID=93222 RepID=A0A5E5B077_9BURK|nr:type I polyketide synthase [Pandoraea sputorum]VVE78836.1 malonyl CoA-ACP transacylase [Pandoraea sputorum]
MKMDQKSDNLSSSGDRIAVIGISCRYPGANGPNELWENVLAKRQQFRSIPACRVRREDFYDEDRSAPDQTYAWQAAVIDGYAFDWQARRIPKSAFEATDIAHWLALDMAIEMLVDAGYVGDKRLPRQTTRVIVGNTLTGDMKRANDLRLRWPYVRSCLHAAAVSAQWSRDAAMALERHMETLYKAPFPQTNEDSLAGGLSNTIPGRIANYLDLNGGCFTIDGACSSSLLAIHAGASSLVAHQCDFVIAGAVDVSIDPFELVGFAKVGALTSTQMRVYDVRGDGFIPGEGCGFVGLKRMDDALRDQDKIYAVLDGWGMSSDGAGGITAPKAQGQHLSHMSAYRCAGASPKSLDFVEGHGTGTVAGDRAELRALGMTLSESERDHSCGVTSFKSIVGHTKAASGMGAFIKSVIAVNQRVLPPTAGCEQPHEAFSDEARSLYPLIRGAVRSADAKLRCGVSAMGFGGINVHVTLTSPDAAPQASLQNNRDDRSAMASWQDSEVFPLAASSLADLRHLVGLLRRDVTGISHAELSDLAARCAHDLDNAMSWRAAITADSPAQLAERLASLDQALANARSGESLVDRSQGYAFGNPAEPPDIGMLFPGQGSQQLGMARALIERYPWARDFAEQAQRWVAKHGPHELLSVVCPALDRYPHRRHRGELIQTLQKTEWAQPSIVLASLLWLQMLSRLGIRPTCVAGHSLGELVAFHAAGAYDMQSAVELAALRGRAMAANRDRPGAMLGLACGHSQAKRFIEGAQSSGYAIVANVNSDSQVVVSGEANAIDAVQSAASQAGVATALLPVSNAFHSRLVASAADALRDHSPVVDECGVLNCVLISSTDGLEVPQRVGLRDHFANQVLRPVDFVTTLKSMARHVDVMLEVGPGNVLTHLAGGTAATQALRCLPVESKAETWSDINWALANLHALGANIKWHALHARRIVRPFVGVNDRAFIVSPCERLAPRVGEGDTRDLPDLRGDIASQSATLPPAVHTGAAVAEDPFSRAMTHFRAIPHPAPVPATAAVHEPEGTSAWSVLKRLSSTITGFSASAIESGTRPLDDLNLDSIKTADMIARASEALGIAPGTLDVTALSIMTLGGIAQAMDAAMRKDGGSGALQDFTREVTEVLFDEVSRVTGFDKAHLTPTLRLLDDLNLDSIKAAAVLGEVMRRTGAQGKLEATALAYAALGDIADAISKSLGTGTEVACAGSSVPVAVAEVNPTDPADPADPANPAAWVRAFELVSVPTVPRANSGKVSGKRFRIWPVEKTDTTYREIAEVLSSAGADVGVDFGELGDHAEHCVVVLPRRPSLTPALGRAYIASLVQPLHSAVAVATRLGCTSITFVQFGLGELFGLPSRSASSSPETSCAQAFAASLRMERPDWRVHILDFPSSIADELVARRLLESATDPAKYLLRFHNDVGKPHSLAPHVVDVNVLPARPIEWSDADVILATGGAKGITAELTLAFAKHTRARVALVGRANPDAPEVRATLAGYARENLRAEYFSCDLCHPEAVAELIRDIGQRLGPVSGLIHGAGHNVPRRIEQVGVDQAIDEVAPKLQSLLALDQSLSAHPLKLVVALGSIIGVTGMPGNAWYAFANQAMDVALARLGARRRDVSTLTLKYSVWSDIGMAVRLGSVGRLSGLGIAAISPQEGVEHFLHLTLGMPPAKRIVVAASLDGLETWQSMIAPPSRASRFVDNVVRYQPGVEIASRTQLSPSRDPYLNDHEYHGVLLFPTVFGLEAMAACAEVALGKSLPIRFRFENIRLERPVIVTQNGANIEVRALVRPRKSGAEPIQVDTSISAEQTAYHSPHFACTVVFDAEEHALTEVAWPASRIAHLAPGDLYGRRLFQGPLFQRIREIYAIDSSGALTTVDASDQSGEPRSFVAGDPYFRDGLLQTSLLSARGEFLPAKIECIECYSSRGGKQGRHLVRSQVISRTEDAIVSDVTAISADRSVVERMVGYRLQRVSVDDQAPGPEDWVDPGQRDESLLKRALQSACDALSCQTPEVSLRYTPELADMERPLRRARETPQLVTVVESTLASLQPRLGETHIDIVWDDSGKPRLAGGLGERIGVSLAHDGSHCICVGGAGDQGCDVEPILCRDESAWCRLLSNAAASRLVDLMQAGDTLDEAGTRLWCAFEAGIKALGERSISLAPTQRSEGAVLILARGERSGKGVTVLTLPCDLTRHAKKMFAVVVRTAHSAATTDSLNWLVSAGSGDVQGNPGESHSPEPVRLRKPVAPYVTTARFRVAYKDASPPVLTLTSATLAQWMGRLREEHTVDFGRQMLDEFDTGIYGMATNHSHIESLARPETTDLIEGRFWFTRQYGRGGSSLDQLLEWHRIDADGNSQLIARAKMATTWTRIVSHGVIAPSPMPAFYADWLRPRLDAYERAIAAGDFEASGDIPSRLTSPPLHRVQATPTLTSILWRKTFETSLSHANLVGNVYFANYYQWQEATLEHYVQRISRDLPHPSAAREGLHCLSASVNHLREAMPFDSIEVVMALESLHAEGFELRFEHYRLEGNGVRVKLAVGSTCHVWTGRGQPGQPVQPRAMPEVLSTALLDACHASESAFADVAG